MRTTLAMTLLLTATCACTCGIRPVGIPDGYDFPGDRNTIQTWADEWKLELIRPKAWKLWGGMTASSGQTIDGAELPVWETWCGTNEVFVTKTCGETRPRPYRKFHNAAQLFHGDGHTEERLPSFNKFNPAMADFLARLHVGPDGTTARYDYRSRESLNSLNVDFGANTPVADRKIQETPYASPPGGQRGYAAMELKPVFFLVKQNGISIVPLWRGLKNVADGPHSKCSGTPSKNCHPSPPLWKTCVLVDPSTGGNYNAHLAPATPQQIRNIRKEYREQYRHCDAKQYYSVPLGALYSFQLTDREEVASFNSAQGDGISADQGDYAVLVAMHVNTKEIVNWTWQTFWWQPNAPAHLSTEFYSTFPGGTDNSNKIGMPPAGAGLVNGEWRNYAMCTAYLQTQGRRSRDKVVCFNPYLETSQDIPDGTQSNCMTCHGVATVGGTPQSSLSYPPDYDAVVPIDFNHDPVFGPYTRTDFSWAIASQSQ